MPISFPASGTYFYPRPRVEGDLGCRPAKTTADRYFYPRPRVEGDFDENIGLLTAMQISTHALA